MKMNKSNIDYDHEETRPMCEGCNKATETTSFPGLKCNMFATKPSMYVRADECPANPRQRRPGFVKVRVGQGKGKAGGNR